MTQQPTGFALSPQQLAVGPQARVGGTIRAVGPVAVAQVTAALETLVQRHEVLRTTFPVVSAQPLAVVSEQPDAPVFRVEARPDGVDVIWDAPARMLDEASLVALAAQLADLCAGVSHDEDPLQYVDYAGWVLEEGTVSCMPGRGRRTQRTTRRPLPEQGIAPQDWWRAAGADDTERAVLVDGRVGDELVDAVGAYAHWSGSPGATVGWAALVSAPTLRGDVAWEVVDWWSTDGPPLVLRVGADAAWIELDEAWCSPAQAEALLDALLSMSAADAAKRDAERGPSPRPESRASVVAWMGRAAHGLTLTDGARTWTPREVRTRVGQIAAAVSARTGGRRESAVALSARPGLEAVVALLGVWAAGGVAVPVEAGGPAHRIAAQVALVDPVAVVTDDPAARWGVPAVSLTPGSDVWQREPVSPATPLAGQLAATMFTSGSTGAPKGVDVPHAALAAYAGSVVARLGIGPGSSWTLVTPLTADLGFTALLAALWTSGTLVVAPTVEADLAAADWAKITPRHLALLLDTASDPRARLPRTGVVIGGEQWPLTLRDRLLGLRPGLRVVNHYGPTEAAVGVLVGDVHPEDAGEHPALGRALAHARAVVLDEAGEPTEGPGELVVGGASVARGYRGRPALTAERFRPDPNAPGGRCYWTGDLVTRAVDGLVVHAGRRDMQLSINGFRVEPGEVVAALQSHPSVAAAAVTSVDGGASLHAVLVADPTTPVPSLGELRAWLADRLPAALTPAALTWVPVLPTTPTGKLDLAAVAALAARPRSSAERPAPRPPTTATEAALVAVWADVLGVRDVGVHDDFFALGGDSIRSLQVVSRARAAGLAFTPQDVFAHPTVQALAAVVTALTEETPDDELPGPVPLLPAAAELLGRDGPDPQHYNQAFWLTAAEPLDVPALRAALAAIVARHDVLRTAFLPGLRGWRSELVDGVDDVPLAVVDLRDDADPTAGAAGLAQAAQRELMLGRPPLMACWVVRLPAGDRLLWVAHHLVVDAVSWQVLFEQVQRAYLQVRAGVAVDLGPRTVSHRAWALGLAAGSDATPDLPGGHSHNETSAHPPDPLTVADTVTVTSALPADVTADLLDRAAPALRVSPVAAVVGLVLAALAQIDPSRVPDVEVELHGRDLVPGLDAARTVGWLTTRHVVRPVVATGPAKAPPSGDDAPLVMGGGPPSDRDAPASLGVVDWLRAAAQSLADARSTDSRSGAGGPVPAVGLTYLGRTQRQFPTGSPFTTFAEVRSGVRAPTTPVRWPLEIAAEVVDGCLQLHCTAAASPSEQASVDGFVQTLPDLVAALAAETADATAPLRPEDFPDAELTTDDLDALLEQWQAEGFG